MKIKTTIKQEYYYTCPYCGETEHKYTHLINDKKPCSFGPWYCDKCGNGFNGIILENNTIIKNNNVEDCSKIRTLSLLKFSGKVLDPEDNFYIIVEGGHYLPMWKDDEIGDHSQYYFEEHTCPINFLRVPTIFRNETDYHGIFTWIKTIPFPTKDEFDKLTDSSFYDKKIGFDLSWNLTELSVHAIEQLFNLSDDQKLYVSEVFLHCDKCNAPRKTKVCFKCNSETRVPAQGWTYPRIPDLEPLIKLARSLGYAIAKHGSMERDVDLIAVPWVEEAVELDELIYTLKKDLKLHQIGDIETKPNGRIALSLQFDSYTKTIDLSIMPKTKTFYKDNENN